MIDRYTKVCLTVIAVSLAVIGLRGLPLVDSAWAGKSPPFVASQAQCAKFKSYSSIWVGNYMDATYFIREKGNKDQEEVQEQAWIMSNAEFFATIYNAFCKD
jgi:hypothetical protein